MIPALIDIGGSLSVLPPGVHDATLDEIEQRFAVSDHRKELFSGLKKGIDNLRQAGCKIVFLNGSFVTDKAVPNDYDACWDHQGVIIAKLDPVFLVFEKKREKQKKSYYGEYFPAFALADGVINFYEYFQFDKYTGKAKGIIKINL